MKLLKTLFPHPVNKKKFALSSEQKKEKIAQKMGEILEILGLDLSDPTLAKTPDRIAKMYVDEIFWGLDPENFPETTLHKECLPEESVYIKKISFVSFCEHHFVPMIGSVNIAYIPKKHLLGFSKIHRIVHYFAARPQLQERLTAQIADCLSTILETEDVAVSIEAKHFCVLARGVKDASGDAETFILNGKFKEQLRSEFFLNIK